MATSATVLPFNALSAQRYLPGELRDRIEPHAFPSSVIAVVRDLGDEVITIHDHGSSIGWAETKGGFRLYANGWVSTSAAGRV